MLRPGWPDDSRALSPLWEQQQRPVDASQLDWQAMPGLAVISRMPHFAIAQSGVDMTRSRRIGEQRVGHMIERLRQPSSQWLPKCPPNRTSNHSLSVVLAVS